jgi:hypothetical protein
MDYSAKKKYQLSYGRSRKKRTYTISSAPFAVTLVEGELKLPFDSVFYSLASHLCIVFPISSRALVAAESSPHRSAWSDTEHDR